MPLPPTESSTSFPLAERLRPDFEGADESEKLRIVDLFAGCGGLTLGAAQASYAAGRGIDVRLAVDFEQSATAVYSQNFPQATVRTDSVESFFDGSLGADPSVAELATRALTGKVDLLVGGPPCQGHSDLNNRTRRSDPKNELYLRMARAAEILKPTFVLIENVPTVRHDTVGVVQTTREHLEGLGYRVAAETLGLHALGVAQKRRRHIVLASRDGSVDPQSLLDDLKSREPDPAHNLRWAIGDLENLEARTGYDVEPRASDVNRGRMEYLQATGDLDLPNHKRPACHQSNHSYKSMYGRLSWDSPAQTVTSGFGSIGQGRYMHPSQLRALTAHEAARIQGFPDYFDFTSISKRADLAVMIGNAVPPALLREVAKVIVQAMAPTRDMDEPFAAPSNVRELVAV